MKFWAHPCLHRGDVCVLRRIDRKWTAIKIAPQWGFAEFEGCFSFLG